jgi:hypothetical protein
MKIDELMRVLDILNVEPQIAELVEFAYRRGEQNGRLEGAEEAIKHMSQVKPKSKPLTTGEIVDCFTAVCWCDPNDVKERDIKFAREIERLTLERQ